MLSEIPVDHWLILGLGLLACVLILWIGRLPKQDFDAPAEETQKGK